MSTHWGSTGRKYRICVDSYEQDVLKGRICDPARETEYFTSMTQFLLKMETLLDEKQMPQAFTEHRRFAEPVEELQPVPAQDNRKGARCTFDLKVIFRQNSSWQGTLSWREARREQNFRSVLELVVLMDSALRSA